MAAAQSGTLTGQQIGDYAAAAGFSGGDVDTAVAVALAESGGNPKAYNGKPPDNSYGLWQINMIGGLGPARRRAFGLSANDELFDPATNAKAAYRIFRDAGGKWTPWTTYTSGSYRQYLGKSGGGRTRNDTSPPVSGVPDSPSWGPGSWVAAIQDSIYQFTETIRMSVVLLLIILIAIALFVMGFVILNKENLGKVLSMTGAGKISKIAKVAS